MQQQPVAFPIRDQTMWLSPEKCMFWENQKSLILCDLHLGKSGHFRKEGIGVPQHILEHDLSRLDAQIEYFLPTSMIIIGDLFHSRQNLEVNYFSKWRKINHRIEIHLIQGNHDILPAKVYDDLNITLHSEEWKLSSFLFRHERTDNPSKNQYEISGHIHPGIRMKGKGKQSLKFPCFYFTEFEALMPAFGKFTGLHIIEPAKKSLVFAVADNQIIQI
jgi:DNA ligase-associated metallophosphoesterase